MLNLVPPEVKKRKGIRSLAYIITLVYIILVSVLVLGLAGLISYNYTQRINLAGKQSQLDSLVAERNKSKDVLSQAAFIDNRVKNVAAYQSAYDWNIVLNAIAGATPTDLTLSSIKIASEADKLPTITISGKSSDRRSVILFENKLAITKPFSGASITSLTESKSEDETTYSFTISVGVTKGGK